MELDTDVKTVFRSDNYKVCYSGTNIVPALTQLSGPVPGDFDNPPM